MKDSIKLKQSASDKTTWSNTARELELSYAKTR